jgi:large subunit ribosomal protein L10
MNREKKALCAGQMQDRFKLATLVVLTTYRGLRAGQLDRLRAEVRGADGTYQVAKNTLMRRAFGDSGPSEFSALLVGPTAIVFAHKDPVAVAKVVVRFAGDNDALEIRGGLLDGAYLTADAIKQLAELPSREEILGQLLALLQAPATRLLRTLNEPGARLVRFVEALRQRQEGQSEGP